MRDGDAKARLLYPLLLISRDQNLSSVMNDILLKAREERSQERSQNRR